MASNEELQQQLDTMRAEMAELRQQIEGRPEPPEPPRLLSRRNLLRAAPVAAAGGVIAAMSASPAAATTGQPLLLGQYNSATGSDETHLETPLSVDGDFWFSRVTSTGFTVNEGNGAAVSVQDLSGGTSLDVAGGSAEGSNGDAIHGHAAGAVALAARAIDIFPRFSTVLQLGTAITAAAQAGHAIVAATTSTTTTEDAVTIDYAGKSRALYAQSHNAANINGTITGVNEGHGIGVWGEQRNNTGAGIGMVGVGGTQGRGAQFTGGVAQARLVPGASASHPTTGKTGDLYVDSAVRLWFCTKASAGGSAAVWKQIA
ncbi:MAG: hypothetical protein QOG75_5632 [Mycobacterium sp.]|nr:hypothetical protein [Mycobacterium sp.]